MNIVISIKSEYFKGKYFEYGDEKKRRPGIFVLKHTENQNNNYYSFTEDNKDILYIIEALPFGYWKFAKERERKVKRQLSIQEECYFIFHDKDIRKKTKDTTPYYSSPFSHLRDNIWIFQHDVGDEIYNLLTRDNLDFQTLFSEIYRLLNI